MSTYTNLLYHIVFSTKQRIPLITKDFKEELYSYIGGIIRNEKGVLLEVGGVTDHIHLLAKLRPTVTISDTLNHIKSNSSKWLTGPKMKMRKFAWQEGYAAFSVSESQVGKIKTYIQTQEEHHRKKTFQEEVLALLKKHKIEYDERYLWD